MENMKETVEMMEELVESTVESEESVVETVEEQLETVEESEPTEVESEVQVEKQKKMTLRQFYTAIIDREEITEEMVEMARGRLQQLDKKNEYAKNRKTPTKKSVANMETKRAIVEMLGDGQARRAKEIAAPLGISTQKASSLLVQLEKENLVTSKYQKGDKGAAIKTYSIE